MAFALAGVPNAVATCGTALADDHFRSLKNLARKVVLAYDADAAGQGAAERWYQWEQRSRCSSGRRPPGRARPRPTSGTTTRRAARRRGRARRRRSSSSALDRVLAAADLSTLEGRARAAEAAAAIVAEHPSDLVRDQYVMKLAGATRHRRRPPARGGGRGAAELPTDARRASARRRRAPRGDSVRADARLRRSRRPPGARRAALGDPRARARRRLARRALFVDPIARDGVRAASPTPSTSTSARRSDGESRELLERLAVEEPDRRRRARDAARRALMVNAVEPVAQRLLTSMLRDGDDRASELKVRARHAAPRRDVGDWDAVQQNATQLVGWIVDGAREIASPA